MGCAQQMMIGGGAPIVYSTWNPADKTSAITLSNANRTLTTTSTASQGVRGTLAHSSGKWYFEVTQVALGSSNRIGIADSTHAYTTGLGADSLSAGYASSGAIDYATSGSAVAATYTAGAVISVAVDVSNKLIYFALNGIWQNSAVPASSEGGLGYVTAAAVYPAWADIAAGVNSATINVGATAFAYTPPAGFSAWQ